MKVMEMELKKLTEAEKRDILGKSGSVDQLSKYLDLTKEDISDGLLIVDAATGRKLNLTSDARSRFERGIDPGGRLGAIHDRQWPPVIYGPSRLAPRPRWHASTRQRGCSPA